VASIPRSCLRASPCGQWNRYCARLPASTLIACELPQVYTEGRCVITYGFSLLSIFAACIMPLGIKLLRQWAIDASKRKLASQKRNSGSVAGSSHSSLYGTHSSRVSDGSIDGSFTALVDLITDHLKFVTAFRGLILRSDRPERHEYVDQLYEFRTAITTQKQNITDTELDREYLVIHPSLVPH
jgi:hypothetical protein